MTLQLLHGDCLELMKTLPDKSVDLFICDLPYGCLGNRRGGKRVGKCEKGKPNSNIVVENKPCDWDTKLDLTQFWDQVKRLCKNDNTTVIHFCNTRFGAELITSNPEWFRYDLVWNKERGVSFLSANKMPMKSHEMIYVFSKKGAYYKRIDIEGDYPNTKRGKGVNQSNVYDMEMKDEYFKPDTSTTHRCPLSVINCQTKAVKGRHPTEKPLDLYTWLITRYCPKDGTVLDPTAGSFNSGLASKELGLNYIGIEKDDTFFENGKQKFEPVKMV